jgi:hypothetical protein
MRKRANWLFVLVFLTVSVCWVSAVLAQVTLEVLSPRAEIPPARTTASLSPRVADLAGKKIGLVANYKAGAELFLTKIEELLKKKFPTATILRFRVEREQKDFSDIAKQIDAFVHSTGD